ncbi:MAG: DUF169 domain-containing protein [bacterium]
MESRIKSNFAKKWDRHFPGAELPLVFYYADDAPEEPVHVPEGWHCLICDLIVARRGEVLYYDADTVGCGGARRSLGFSEQEMPDLEYFLSCGIAGRMEGERYKSSPEIVKRLMANYPRFKAPGRYIVFKRWDKVAAGDEPEAVIFFATPDVLSGLFTLANYEEEDPHGVIAPFASGCASIVHFPHLEGRSEHPRATLGMFDVSARPCVEGNILTITVPWLRFTRMVDNMDESFLITGAWDKVRRRIKGK